VSEFAFYGNKTFTGLDDMSKTTGVLLEAETAYPSRTSGFTQCVIVALLFSFLCCVGHFCHFIEGGM
jgi:hypothetical protein